MRAIAALVVAIALQPQVVQQPPRDPRQPREVTGNGTIRGHVTAADTGAPIRKASVMLTYTPPVPPSSSGNTVSGGSSVVGGVVGSVVGGIVGSGPVGGGTMRPRQVQTDQNGGFEFTQLAAGTYRVMVTSPQYSGQYLGIAYGATKPMGPGGDPGKSIDLANGETFDKANSALPRGGVIVGRVTDESGLPMARVGVYGLYYPNGGSRGNRTGGGTQTDDLGQFRVFGLQPGEYAVVAEARNMTYVPPGQPLSDSDDDRTGYLTTFYPSSSDETNAQRVRVAAGRETIGIEIRLVTGRMYRISGTVIDSQGQPLSGANGQLVHRMVGGAAGFSSMGFATDPQGKFQMQNIPGGDYRIIIRQRPMGPPVNGQPPDPGEMAMMPLTLSGTDADNLLIATSTGTTITGHVVFEPMPPDTTNGRPTYRVSAMNADPSMGMGMISPAAATVQQDGSFTMKGLMGEYMLRISPLQPSWYVKSITAGTDDVLDSAHAFKQGDDVTVVISTRAATLDGTVTDEKGQPAENASLVLFSDDKASWRMNSTWTRRLMGGSQGRFRITGLRPGRYYVVALPREQMNTLFGASDPKAELAFFEGLAKDATAIVINEDEQRTIDLRVTNASSGS